MYWQTTSSSLHSLISNLKEDRVIKNYRVEQAMLAVDRKLFAETDNNEIAYEDVPLPIGYGQTISAPHMHAICLELLKDHLKPGNNALDVGSGSGYLLACMGYMMLSGENSASTEEEEVEQLSFCKICGIDYYKELVEQSIQNLNKNPITKQWLEDKRIEVITGDGWKGFPNKPDNFFHAIHVGAAAESVPHHLLKQLALGGRMIIPVGHHRFGQALTIIDKGLDGKLSEKQILDVMYVPLQNPHHIK